MHPATACEYVWHCRYQNYQSYRKTTEVKPSTAHDQLCGALREAEHEQGQDLTRHGHAEEHPHAGGKPGDVGGRGLHARDTVRCGEFGDQRGRDRGADGAGELLHGVHHRGAVGVHRGRQLVQRMRLVRHEHESGCGHEQRVGDRDGPFMRAAEHHHNIHDGHADKTTGDEFRRKNALSAHLRSTARKSRRPRLPAAESGRRSCWCGRVRAAIESAAGSSHRARHRTTSAESACPM